MTNDVSPAPSTSSAGTAEFLDSVLAEVWCSLSSDQQMSTSKSLLTKRLSALAATGERDRLRLGLYALTGVDPPPVVTTWKLNSVIVGEPAVDRFVARLNVERFEKLLAEETDETKRRFLECLLAEEEKKFETLPAPPAVERSKEG